MSQNRWWDHESSENIWFRVLKWDYKRICDTEEESSKFRRVIGKSLFWRMKLERDFPFHPISETSPRHYRQVYEEQMERSHPAVSAEMKEAISKMHRLVCDIEKFKKN